MIVDCVAARPSAEAGPLSAKRGQRVIRPPVLEIEVSAPGPEAQVRNRFARGGEMGDWTRLLPCCLGARRCQHLDKLVGYRYCVRA